MTNQRSNSMQLLTYLERLFAALDDPTDLTEIRQRIADLARDFLKADLVAVYSVNPLSAIDPHRRKFLRPPTISGNLHKSAKTYDQKPRPDGATQEIIEKGTLFVEDMAQSPRYQGNFVISEGISSYAGVALRPDNESDLLGIIYVDYREPRIFSNAERYDLSIFARFAATLLSFTWYLRRYQEVSRIGQEINQDLGTIQSIFEKLQRHLPGIIDVHQAMLLAIYQPQQGTLNLHLTENNEYKVFPEYPLDGGSKWVIEQGQSLLVHQLSQEVDALKQMGVNLIDIPDTKPEVESLIFVPLMLRDTKLEDAIALGVLSVQHEQPNRYDSEDLHLLEALGRHLALAISNIRMFSGLERLTQSGQALTRHLESEQLLDEVVFEIQQATRADIVVLYPYNQTTGSYALPPRQCGNFLVPEFRPHTFVRPDDMAALTIQKEKPEFARSSHHLYTKIGGDPQRRLGSFETREGIASTAALPLRVGDDPSEPVGALFVNFRVRQRFDAPQKQMIQSLANYAAIAIRNAKLLDSAQHRHITDLELLRDIDAKIGSILDLQELLQGVLELVGEHIQVDEASVLLYDPQEKVLNTVAAIGRHAEISREQKISLDDGRGIVREVFAQRKPIRIDNVHTEPEWREKHLEVASDTLSELDVPIFNAGEVIGIINMENTREAAFSQADQEFLVTLAGQAVLAIKNAEAYEREKRVSEERQALVDIGKEIVSKLDPQLVFDAILQKALEVTNCQAGNLMLFDPQRKDLWMAAERGVIGYEIGHRLSLDEGVVGQVATHKKPLNVDVCSSSWKDVFLGFIPDSCSELAVPLLEGDRLRGVLNIESTARNYFKKHDERLLAALADMAVIALRNVEQFASVTEGRERLKALNRVDTKIIAQADNPDAVMRAIVENALLLTQADSSDLSLYIDGDLRVSYFAHQDESQNIVTEIADRENTTDLPQGIIAHVAATRQAYWTKSDAQSDPYFLGKISIASALAVPLLTQNQQMIGVLNLESRVPYAFDAEDAEIIQLLAGQAVIAYNLAQSYTATESEKRRFEDLYRVGEEIAELVDIENTRKAYEIVANKLAARSTSGQVVIRRLQEDTQELVLVHCVQRRDNPPRERMKLDEGVNGRVAEERKTVIIHDTRKDLNGVRPKLSDPQTRSLIVAPIDYGQQFYGTLTLSESRYYAFGESDVRLLEGLARQLALTLYRLEITEANSQAEQRISAAEAMSAMGQSAFELAHRLGNDLGLVNTYVENLEDILKLLEVNSDDLSTELNKIHRDVTKVLNLSHGMKEIFNDFRDGKRPKLSPVSIPPEVLIEEAVLSLPELPNNITIEVHVEPETPSVSADHSQIADTLRNLYTNAVQAMSRKGGVVSLRAHNVGRFVEFQVSDTGPGIPKDIQIRIFDLFYSTKGSTGFGLWSARRNALANGGDLTVTSEPGQGATFVLLLPKADSNMEGRVEQ